MHLRFSSAAGVRFLMSVREGRGFNRSSREAGVGKQTGYRWLREAYIAYRRGGKSIAETEAEMGLASAMSIAWEAEVAAGPGRHHLRVAVDTEAGFWAVYDTGGGADAAASAAGVGRSTAYQWLDGDSLNSAPLGSPPNVRASAPAERPGHGQGRTAACNGEAS
jgi:transposase, IS30 family